MTGGQRWFVLLAVALLLLMLLIGLLGGRGSRTPVADCGSRGVQIVRYHADPYNEIVVCKDGRVFNP